MGDVFTRLQEGAKGCIVGKKFCFAEHTSIGTGGPAEYFVRPLSQEGAQNALSCLYSLGIPAVYLGAGSNVLASDQGFGGAAVCTDALTGAAFDGALVTAGSGVKCGSLLTAAARRGLGGLSFMAGIPASVGGAVRMNAGTAAGHIGELCQEAVCCDGKGKLFTFSQSECAFSYKHTAFADNGMLILRARLRLRQSVDPFKEIAAAKKARSGLPRGRSMGCVFKNPPDASAGALIERCGLKGARSGGAYVAEEHANFIINGGASSAEIRALAEHIRRTVLEKTGVLLQEEIVYIGEF